MSKTHLTRRQYEVLMGVAMGKTTQQISDELGIKPSTVRQHLIYGYRRLGVHDRAGALVEMAHRGMLDWVPPPDDEKPFAATHPWLHVYLREFDRFLQGEEDARLGMRVALLMARRNA